MVRKCAWRYCGRIEERLRVARRILANRHKVPAVGRRDRVEHRVVRDAEAVMQMRLRRDTVLIEKIERGDRAGMLQGIRIQPGEDRQLLSAEPDLGVLKLDRPWRAI